MAKLTPDLLKNALPAAGSDRLELRDDDEPGLIFRVTTGGVRSWSLRYRNSAGEQRRKSLGNFPATTLAGARQEARKVKAAVDTGVDPVAEERRSKAAEVAKRLRTFHGLADAYFADAELGLHRPNAKSAKRSSTMAEERRIFDRLVAPKFGDVPIEDVKRADIQAFVTAQSRKATSNGRHCRTVLRQLLSYAVWKELLDHNPAHDIAVVAPAARERILTDKELAAVWRACAAPQDVEDLKLSPEMGLAIRMAAVTLQRGGEVTGMRRSEIDRKARIWLIPAGRMKGKRPHLVPLSDLALSLLDEADALIAGEDFIFQSPRRTEGEPVAPIDRRSFSRAMARVVDVLELPRATPHDLRRTGATAITSERIGIPRFIVSQVIAHAGDTGGAAAVTGRHYDLNDYLPDKRRALDAWAALLSSIVNAQDRADNVTDLRKIRAGK